MNDARTNENLKAPISDKSTPQRIFYPILFAIFPVLSVYSANLAMVPALSIWRPVVAVALGAGLIWFLLSKALKSSSRGAIATSVILAMFFCYSQYMNVLHSFRMNSFVEFRIWLGTTVGVTALATILWRWHKILNFLSATMVIAALGQSAFGLYSAKTFQPVRKENPRAAVKITGERPDIFYIILDGYGRSDALKRAIGFDNGYFVQGLKDRGFFVAEDSKANYCQTELSVASSLNFDFIPALLPKMDAANSHREPLEEIIDKNSAAEYLRERGYIFGSITTGFPPLRFDSADISLRKKIGFTLIETALLQMTPLSDRTTLESLFSERRDSLLIALENLQALNVPAPTPRFVVAHILAPHPPFVFGPNGEEVAHKGPYGYWDGSDFMAYAGSQAEYRDGYAGQAEYLSKQILHSLDVILKAGGKKPVIIIQGDHGSKLRLDQESLDKTDVNECFPNLNAYYVPDSVRKNLYPGVTPVNSFRILFNGLFNDKFELREDRSWYSPFGKPYAFTEVTSKIANHAQMPTVPVPGQQAHVEQVR
jgi:hypothetical protein